jgi:hypothetical protein
MHVEGIIFFSFNWDVEFKNVMNESLKLTTIQRQRGRVKCGQVEDRIGTTCGSPVEEH